MPRPGRHSARRGARIRRLACSRSCRWRSLRAFLARSRAAAALAPLFALLLRVLIIDVRAEADLGECETRLRTTTTLLPPASTIATSKNLFIARRHRRSSLGVPDAAEEADTPRYSTISSLNHYLQNLINSALRRSLPFLLDAPLDLGWELGSHSFLTSHSSSPPLVRECFAPPLAYLFRRRVLTVENYIEA